MPVAKVVKSYLGDASVPMVQTIGYIPTGELLVAVVTQEGVPEVLLAAVSPFTNPESATVNVGIELPRIMVLSFGVNNLRCQAPHKYII